MSTLPTREQVQAKFDAARDVGLSPCAWIPPKWEVLQELQKLEPAKRFGLPNNSSDNGEKFGDATQTGVERIDKGNAKKPPKSPESKHDPDFWANPFADFTHIDESEFRANDLGVIEEAVQAFPKVKKEEREAVLGRLKRIVGAESPGMKRLGQIFDWALYRTTVLMKDMNDALELWKPGITDAEKAAAKEAYETAQKNYINFLKDLDNHEPEKNAERNAEKNEDKTLDVKKKDSPSGYGRSLKWACIDPVIFEGRIVGTRVIIHWNPHSSSNGVPIPHTP